jgi:hypothetical protein
MVTVCSKGAVAFFKSKPAACPYTVKQEILILRTLCKGSLHYAAVIGRGHLHLRSPGIVPIGIVKFHTVIMCLCYLIVMGEAC